MPSFQSLYACLSDCNHKKCILGSALGNWDEEAVQTMGLKRMRDGWLRNGERKRSKEWDEKESSMYCLTNLFLQSIRRLIMTSCSESSVVVYVCIIISSAVVSFSWLHHERTSQKHNETGKEFHRRTSGNPITLLFPFDSNALDRRRDSVNKHFQSVSFENTIHFSKVFTLVVIFISHSRNSPQRKQLKNSFFNPKCESLHSWQSRKVCL